MLTVTGLYSSNTFKGLFYAGYYADYPFKCHSQKMVKHTQRIRLFDYFPSLCVKGLNFSLFRRRTVGLSHYKDIGKIILSLPLEILAVFLGYLILQILFPILFSF